MCVLLSGTEIIVILVFMLLNEQIQIALICNVKSLNKIITAVVIKPVLEAPLPLQNFVCFPYLTFMLMMYTGKRKRDSNFRNDSVFGKGR